MKPQSAFFERFGAAGITVLERTVRLARDAGALVILDVKRGDIGSTMTAYADAYLAPGAPLAVDAITVEPLPRRRRLGAGLRAHHAARGRACSCSGSRPIPRGRACSTRASPTAGAVAQLVVDELADRNVGAAPFGSLGIVVGATIGTAAVDLRGLNGPVLMPGVGVGQGGTAEDVRRISGTLLPAVVPSVSREVLRRGPDVRSLRDATRRLIDAFAFLRA